MDGRAIADFVAKSDLIDNERVYLLGRSLGGAVAISTLVENQRVFKGAIIENTFTGISEMADQLFPFLKLVPWLKQQMLKVHWDSLDKVAQINCPVLFVTGDLDSFVPTHMTK